MLFFRTTPSNGFTGMAMEEATGFLSPSEILSSSSSTAVLEGWAIIDLLLLLNLSMLHQIELDIVVDMGVATGHELVWVLLDSCIKNVAVRLYVCMGRDKVGRNGKDRCGCLFFVFSFLMVAVVVL